MKTKLQNIDEQTLAKLDTVMDKLQGEIPSDELKEMLDQTAKGGVKQTLQNCVRIFRHDPVFYRKIRYNILTQRDDIIGDVPWSRACKGEVLSNSDLRAIHLYVSETYGITSENVVDEAMYLVADECSYHPVRDYLNRLPAWDGTERIRFALHHFLGADTSDYTYELMKFFMLGAISRVFHPGIKFDYMLCLVGDQGAGKSSFFRLLATRDEWFCDDLKNLEAKDVYEKMQGHWIIEMSEMMAAINARTNEAIKSFLSRQKETYRTKYERLPEDRPRQCVFAGTTNKKEFLPNDRTGNRRFLPIQCHEEQAEVFILDDEEASRAYIDQMWAEAMEIYRAGPVSLKLSKKLEGQIREYQRDFVPEDVDAGLILSYMQDTKEEKVCSKMLFKEALGNEYTQPLRWQTNDICEIVNQLIRRGDLKGWCAFDNPRRFGNGYGTQRGWEKVPEIVNEPVSTETQFRNLTPGEQTPFDEKTE